MQSFSFHSVCRNVSLSTGKRWRKRRTSINVLFLTSKSFAVSFFFKKRTLLLHSKSYCKDFQEISVQQINKGSMSKKIYTHMCLSSWTTEVKSSSYSQKFPLLLQNNGFWGKNSHGFSIHQADLTVNLILLNCHSNLSLRSVFFTMGYEASV